jgi:hypothetical protein
MSDFAQRQENDRKVNFMIDEVCGTDADAKEYLTLMAGLARIVDDIADDFEMLSQNTILAVVEILFIRIPGNSFYKKNQDLLFSQHLSMWNAWESSNVLDAGDVVDKIYAHVLRDYINELYPIVALLTQGHDKMKETNGSIRSLFKKNLGE